MTKYAVLLPAIEIDTTNQGIRMTENATTATASIAVGTYFARGDGASDDLLKVIDDAIEAATASVNTYTIAAARSANAAAVSGSVTFTRASGADTFRFAWADALTTFDESLLGFTDANTALDANPKVGTLSPEAWWVSSEIYASFEPTFPTDGAVTRARSGKVRGVRRGGPYEERLWEQEMVDSRRVLSQDNTSDPTATLQAYLARWGDGTRFEFHGVTASSYPTLGALSSSTLIGTFHLSEDALRNFDPKRIDPGVPLYDWTMRLLKYVA